jgi:hypothetical protein
MSSSFRIKKRFEEFNNTGAYDFGNFADHYIAPWGNCHPNFVEHAIGRPDGVKVCVRRVGDLPPRQVDPPKNGLTRFSPNLYYPDELPGIDNNTYRFNARRMPNEEQLSINDYKKMPIKYSGIGANKVHIPRDPQRKDEGVGNGMIYYEYYLDQSLVAPAKYDVTHLHQRYPLWREAMKRRGYTEKEIQEMDLKHNEYITPI